MTPADRADWLSWRRGEGTADAPTVGATDCAAVLAARLGWHTYRTPGEIWRDRWKGRPPETLDDPKRFILDIGHAAEPMILRRWHALKGYAPPDTDAPPMRLTIPPIPWWRGSPDALPVDGWIVDSKTTHWQALGHFFTATTNAPCWPALYLCQLAQYAVAARAAGYDVYRVALAFIDLSAMDGTLHTREALLSDPVSDHIDPDLTCPVDADGAPLTVEALGLACLATGAAFRATYLLGDAPPCPPDDGPVADWWAARPRPRPSSRPATEAEADALATYLIAHVAEQEAKATKAQTKAEIVRLMTEGDPVARIYCDLGSVSINEGGRITVTAKR